MRDATRGGAGVRTLTLAALVLSGMIVGCEADGTGPATEFDEAAAAADVGAVLGAVDDDITSTLLLAAQGLASAGASTSLVPNAPASLGRAGFAAVGDLGSAKVEAATASLLPALSLSGSSAMEPIFPSNLLGVTFVWNGTDYVPDDTIPGAPANGVRFIVYAINPATRLPVEPLVEVGYLDLTDDGSAASTRLGLLLVDTSGAADVTLVDYFIDVSFTATQTASSATLAAIGFVSDGTETLSFDLVQTLTFEESGGGSITVDYAFDLADAGLGLGFEAAVEFDSTTETSTGVQATMTLAQDGNIVVLDVLESATGTLDGDISFNGETVILVSGTAVNPTFTRPDGSELTAVEVQALVDIVDAVTEILLIAEELFAPIGGAGA